MIFKPRGNVYTNRQDCHSIWIKSLDALMKNVDYPFFGEPTYFTLKAQSPSRPPIRNCSEKYGCLSGPTWIIHLKPSDWKKTLSPWKTSNGAPPKWRLRVANFQSLSCWTHKIIHWRAFNGVTRSTVVNMRNGLPAVAKMVPHPHDADVRNRFCSTHNPQPCLDPLNQNGTMAKDG